MIEILDFERDLFNNLVINKQTLTRHTYITTKKLATQLLTMPLPITNKRKAMIKIFDFLNYIDTHSREDNTLNISSALGTIRFISPLDMIHFHKAPSLSLEFRSRHPFSSEFFETICTFG